ncbi:MAG: hypothetical protein A2152_04015 [Candidatus Levybacteria bacterium RBG_16_35_6]|nr:MAG: hypothetical protein A2152_04015 [Candidatus Levybacteria bacterium RBG_16_35_6]
MKNKIIIIVIVLILIVAGFLGYTKLAGKSSINPTVSIETQDNNKENGITGTIKGLLEKNLTQKCTITYPDNQGTGTIYVSGKKFSGDFTINLEGQKITSHTISDGVYFYSWADNSTTGIKMMLSEAEKNTAPTGTEEQQKTGLNEEVKYSCSGWSLDQSKFTPPSNITFSDFSNLIPKTTGSTEKNPTMNEEEKAGNSICDQITDPTAKASCLNAIQSSGE